MISRAEPSYQPRSSLRPAVGVLGDDLTVRRIRATLGSDYRVVAHGQTVDALLDAERAPFDVAVLAGANELLASGGPVELLRNLRPSSLIVIVAMTEDVGVIRKALRRGANGFVFHSALERGLTPAVAAVLVGHLSVPRAIRRRTSWAAFSVRERQVLQLVAEGLTNSEIADRLYLSESTIKCHLSSGFRKLGVCSRAEAAAAVLDPHSGLMVSLVSPAHRVPERELAGSPA
jgi:DNA-binding NarL/FixJ family response regulator